MSDTKPFASLSPTLLARKGGARPAMRPQLQPLGHYPAPEPTMPSADPGDDLGWNDMGEPSAPVAEPFLEPAPETVVSFVPADTVADPRPEVPRSAPLPEVVRQQDALATQVEQSRVADVASSELIPLARHRLARAERDERNDRQGERRSALADGRRAAFTLRVDGDRHLKLRLACTVQGRSAQQLVTQALDRLLDELPELEDLARRVKRR
jgi:hypothetical protein